jgi:pimeloyl-ACP methyl ester carboxylesterase
MPFAAATGLTIALLAPLGAASAQDPAHDFFTTSDGVRIHYMTAGSEGTWVVLIHGYTDSAERMWFRTGIAPALAQNHRVAALDNRNHGQSDEPEPNGPGRAEDVLELMAHLGIERAHIHGYSMGGGITGQLLSSHPERFLTAGFGGSGIQETDPELRAMAASMDPEAPAPSGAAAAAFQRLRQPSARGAGRCCSRRPGTSGPDLRRRRSRRARHRHQR